jgi:hypothetical protein
MESGDLESRGEIRDFRGATTASFNALRQDFVDLRTHVDNGFTEMRGKFDVMAAGQDQIVELLQNSSPIKGMAGRPNSTRARAAGG